MGLQVEVGFKLKLVFGVEGCSNQRLLSNVCHFPVTQTPKDTFPAIVTQYETLMSRTTLVLVSGLSGVRQSRRVLRHAFPQAILTLTEIGALVPRLH